MMRRHFVLVFFPAIFACLPPARGDFLVTSRAALDGTDRLDWGTVVHEGSGLPNPFTITSSGGITVHGKQTNAINFLGAQQGYSFFGNFAPGDNLIITQDNAHDNDMLTLSFSGAGIRGGGAQIASEEYGSFTARDNSL
jgi:hypothetical protein